MVWLMPLQTGNKRKEPVRERKGNERGRQRKWNEWGSRLERHQAMVQWYELLADDHLADFYFLQWETGKVTLLLLGTGLFFPTTHAIQIQPLKSQMQCMQCVGAGICSEVMVPGKVRGERRRGGAAQEVECVCLRMFEEKESVLTRATVAWGALLLCRYVCRSSSVSQSHTDKCGVENVVPLHLSSIHGSPFCAGHGKFLGPFHLFYITAESNECTETMAVKYLKLLV